MKYLSTRGQIKGLSFEETVMMGLADDGGLLIPETIPQVQKSLEVWRSHSFRSLSFEILSLFIGNEIPQDDLKLMIHNSYQTFRHPQITPVVPLGNRYMLELFHGPTFAFKDIALQFLGNLFEYFLQKRGHSLTVLGATSGDTGSAAIYGLRGKQNIDVFMLHPKGRVSRVQELQMTTVLDSNIHNLAVEGTFDDAQAIVKSIFNDLEFKQTHHLGAVNSINWARVLAQIVYYFYAYFQVTQDNSQQVSFSVPTGNFGDILAGYYAKKMGLPIDVLIVATNLNDILYRFFTKGEYHQGQVTPTWSPSMDIQISSNFERFLYMLSGQSSQDLVSWMKTFQETGKLTISADILKKAQQEMTSARVTQEETLETIRNIHQHHNYLLDPHTAVGVKAVDKCDISTPIICLATAHPAKFGEAVLQATGTNPPLPEAFIDMHNHATRCKVVSNSANAVKTIITKTLNK